MTGAGGLERFLAGGALALSAVLVGAAYLFEYQGGAGSYRLSRALAFAFGPWLAAGAAALLLYAAGRAFHRRLPLAQLYLTLVCGACAVAIVEALR